MSILRIIALVLLSLWALVQVLLGVSTVTVDVLIGVVFFLAAVCLGAAVFTRSWILLGIGLLASLAGPFLVGVSGIEPFEWIHHVIRLLGVAVLVGLLVVARWRTRGRSGTPARA